MKPILVLLAVLLFFGICADCRVIAAGTNTSSPWQFGPPHASDGYVLVRLERVEITYPGYEMGGHSVGATFQPIEFKYPDNGRSFGGGGGPPHDIKPVETKIGTSFHIGMLTGNSIVPKPHQSIANLLESCASENDPKNLKLNLILSIPSAEAAADWKEEYDYSHWFIESLQIVK